MIQRGRPYNHQESYGLELVRIESCIQDLFLLISYRNINLRKSYLFNIFSG